jgi:exodeoxyribonuclease V alpha subunit
MEHVGNMLSAVLAAHAGRGKDELEIAIGAVLTGLADGHVCVDAAQDATVRAALPVLRELRGVVGTPGAPAPLMLDEDRLYLGRYWQYEQTVATLLRRLAAPVVPMPGATMLGTHLRALFPGGAVQGEHAFAALGAAVRNLAVISGGPGTGKTTTVSRILALKVLLQPAGTPYTIRLAAPTGKAADRLREAIASAKTQMELPAGVLARIPEEASTIHRLLGIKDASGQPQRSAEDPIPADLVVLDEASMIDLSLMAKVVAALRPGAGLILLGDKDQLDAVQPGSVFGELCTEPLYSLGFLKLAEAVQGAPRAAASPAGGGLQDALFRLTRSYRFREEAGIGSFARAVNAGDEAAAVRILQNDDSGELRWTDTDGAAGTTFPADAVAHWLRPYFDRIQHGGTEEECLRLFSAFRLLTPLREGPGSVDELNDRTEQWLRREGLVTGGSGWYPGKPVMITANNYTLGLYNGDVGVTMQGTDGNLRVVFAGTGGTFRTYAPSRLPAFDRAYATTVHKSQGSEFDEVLLLLPVADSPVVTRNLLYTAVTRARHRCIIQGSEEAVRAGTRSRPQKMSGLARAIERAG